LPDDIYERIESLRELIAKAHKITADMDWRNHPELFYSLTYQDGALDAFGKMLSLFSTGDTTNIHHIKHIWADYDKLLRVAIDKERYWDAAYIDGYRNAQICLLMEDDDLRMFPLYEFFDEDDFPPEEDSSWQPSEEAEGDNPTEEEDSEEKQVEEEAQKLPTLLSQDELLEMLAGINEQYPKLFEEANSLISSLPEGTIPQHIPFLDGVTGSLRRSGLLFGLALAPQAADASRLRDDFPGYGTARVRLTAWCTWTGAAPPGGLPPKGLERTTAPPTTLPRSGPAA
jgi:hypothetical protein